jgi:hypothetical protein
MYIYKYTLYLKEANQKLVDFGNAAHTLLYRFMNTQKEALPPPHRSLASPLQRKSAKSAKVLQLLIYFNNATAGGCFLG